MENSIVFDRYYNLSLNYLSIRPRSEKEILDYLAKKQKNAPSLTDEIIGQIIEKLKEYKFINDHEFTRFWIDQRVRSKHTPIRAIEYELSRKGIHKDLIDDALSDSEAKKEMDLKSAKELAQKKMDFYRNLPPEKKREKVMTYLLRKGFSYDTVRKVVKE